jgi:hypothetical protein
LGISRPDNPGLEANLAENRKNDGKTKRDPAKEAQLFQPGNPGRPIGSRNKAIIAAESLLDGEVEGLTRKCIEMAMAGDGVAMKLCLERIVPPRKDRPVSARVPAIDTVADVGAATNSLITSVAEGDLTLSEANEFAKLIELHLRSLELSEIGERLKALEDRINAIPASTTKGHY